MTCIVSYPTKKALKEAIEKGETVYIEDPSIVNPRLFTTDDIVEGEYICVTNHPKRSWFAQIKKGNGILKVV